MNALQIIQQKLKAPKSQFNKFGNYNFRSVEDILEGVKPLLFETESELTLTDKIVSIGGKLFVKAIATLEEGKEDGNSWKVEAYAAHSESQSGMSAAQITGSASSYARKYALNGLFLIDDSKDDDSKDDDATNKHEKPKAEVKDPGEAKKITVVPLSSPGTGSTAPSVHTTTQVAPTTEVKPTVKELPWLNEGSKEWDAAKGKSLEELKKSYRISKANQAKLGL